MPIHTLLRRAKLLLLALCLAPLAQAKTPAEIPAIDFFRAPAVQSPVLSPDGKRIAMLVAGKDGERNALAVADVDTPDKFVGVARFDDADVYRVSWVNDKRLVFDVIDRQAGLGDQMASGLYAINADGSDYVWLIDRARDYQTRPVQTTVRPLPDHHRFVGVAGDGSDDVLVEQWESHGPGHPATATLMRLNTTTKALRRLFLGDLPDNVQGWWVDQKLQPRVLMSFDGKRTTTLYWRADGAKSWTELERQDIYAEDSDGMRPVAIDRDGQLYVQARNKASPDGTTALYRYDVEQRKLDAKPLVSIPGFDFAGSMHFDRRSKQLLGVSYLQDAPGVVWMDKGMREIQAAVDKRLPSTINLLSCSDCSAGRHVVVSAFADVQPTVYFLYERGSGTLKLLGASQPWLDSRLLAAQDFQRIKARDGLGIPTYITKPKGKGPWPTVVLVHGGPFVRGVSWGFDAERQFLASRGYLVVEPEFRGSEGYGRQLHRAGWKQWGLAMQDDVTDVTRWAIEQGLADPARIAIAGASYGGYATMMGLLKEPGLYKAGINWVGVTDIELMYTIGWSDFLDASNPWVRYGMPTLVGDPDKDVEQLRATSPLRQAHRIKQPVLMAYGEEDYRVPLPHGTRMRDALIAAGNRNVEWVQYESEGHGFMLVKNNVDFWTRVERFLAKHLK